MVQELGSSVKEYGDPPTQTSTPKSVEEVATKVMKVDKAVELFQTMVIVSLNNGNLTLEINILKNKLVMGEKEKAMLQEELNKDRKFQKGYKHNVEIWRKNKAMAEKKNKVFIKKLQDENEKLKGNTTQLKSHDEEMQNLRQKAKIQETTKRKWTKALFFHKK